MVAAMPGGCRPWPIRRRMPERLAETAAMPAQAFAFQRDAVSVADDVVPAIDRRLAGGEQRPGIGAFFDTPRHVALLPGRQRL